MSAFYDQASLVVVPSGYKSGKIYAQKPLTTDGQLTFTRASTATRVNSSGLIEAVASGVPRLDYTGSTCPKLLLEPQRTNNLVYSEQFDTATWATDGNGAGETKTANYAISPDGTQNADRIQLNRTGGSYSRIRQDYATAGTHTASVYLKSNTGASQKIWMRVDGSTPTKITITTSWQRFVVSAASSAGLELFIDSTDAEIATIADFSAWGAQLEAGAYATSYIPTLGTSVTRVVETAEKTGISSLIGQTAGSFYFEYVPNDVSVNTSQDYIPFALSDGTSANALFFNDYNGSIRFIIQSSGTVQTIFQFDDLVAGNNYKIAVAYNTNDVALYINGALIGTDSSATIPSTSKIQFNGFTSPVHVASLNVKQTLLFKTRLTNAQLAELTTL